ncbi:hypothetical protein Plec18167_005236 [Paecilomyces lecythidis]|uniref:Methyltransferase domain-containing protein n=1 Tax=Paecilomyces lecythidis TaxID=3004212 RepID=A0ABR3XJN9_9EURO
MKPRSPLPLSDEWKDADSYVDALLSFATTTTLFQNLCGGVHILDFLTREPDLFTTLLPEDWRKFFEQHDIQDILHLLMREDIDPLRERISQLSNGVSEESTNSEGGKWKGGPLPPVSLLDYIHQIRRFSLRRDFTPSNTKGTIPRHVAVGMKPKKCHEVENFSRYVDSLAATVREERGEPVSHIVDFGSGQNYLGRTLVSPPFNKNIIAIERKHHNIAGARGMDVHAKLAEKTVILRNKKEYNKSKKSALQSSSDCPDCLTKDLETPINDSEGSSEADKQDDSVTVINVFSEINLEPNELNQVPRTNGQISPADEDDEDKRPKGAMNYIEHDIQDGYLEPIIRHVVSPDSADSGGESEVSSPASVADPSVMVISLHSCGNLLHHGIRSLVVNPSVVAVAMIGCCYNLMTERLGPATYKLPVLRSLHPRLEQTGTAYDPHGFPMSKRLEDVVYEGGTGMKLNITARMMAVQAPYNWGKEDSESFFTRHFYRALLQRILLDKKIIPKPGVPADPYSMESASEETPGTPLIVGSLRKGAFNSFNAYVRAAVSRLVRDPNYGPKIDKEMSGISDEELEHYVEAYNSAKHNLSVVWSLMAFSANVVEAIIVTDRWQFLREHDVVKDCWVEPVFDYGQSPRNLAVIGIKH